MIAIDPACSPPRIVNAPAGPPGALSVSRNPPGTVIENAKSAMP